jgi:hypothetical protein
LDALMACLFPPLVLARVVVASNLSSVVIAAPKIAQAQRKFMKSFMSGA